MSASTLPLSKEGTRSPAKGRSLDLAGVAELQALKTGALIRYGARAGAILAEASSEDEDALDAYAQDLGLVFQIADDILDVTATTDALGKPAGQDEGNDKATFC
ncbi:MAG: hypothetical protein HC902_11025, partial [Calothrix sp. SM1_5_4]|nr:hypothetical protein [Calothrix sp. SM1_5_4]